MSEPIELRELQLCFEGVIPAVIATAAANGTPNVTYLSRVRLVDGERVAVSNQFFSKTQRNLAENPRASLLIIDPTTFDEYRLQLRYERTEKRGQVFDLLRDDVDEVAALSGLQDVFKLRAADIYRVLHIERTVPEQTPLDTRPAAQPDVASTAQLAELTARLSRSADLDALVSATVDGLAEVLGYAHSLLLLVDDDSEQLFTIASHGYEEQGVGSEVRIGEGTIGMAAARCTPIRVGSLRQMAKYSQGVRKVLEDRGDIAPGREIPVPGLADAESRIAVPAMALGQLVGVLVVESPQTVAFNEVDEALLTVVASIVANGIESERARDSSELDTKGKTRVPSPPPEDAAATQVRFFAVDGSTFLDGDYLIKGVAGRILWSLLGHYEREGRVEFTNREIRLDPSLELPDFRDNFESRLILLKRRLDERDAPVRIEKTGRGRFQLVVETALRLEAVSTD